MKAGLFIFQVSKIPFPELLDLAQEVGIQAMELGVSGHTVTPGFEVETLTKDVERRAEILKQISDHGMVVSALNAMCNPLHPDQEVRAKHLEGLKAAISLAAEIGVGRVVTGSGCPGESERSRHPAWVVYSEGFADVLEWQWHDVATPVWKDLAAFANHHGVRICIEVHPGMLAYNTDSFLRLKDIGGDAVGANFDPSHMLWQGMDPRVVARALSGCIYHAHAKDTVINAAAVSRNGVIETRPFDDWTSRAWSFCAVGDGHDAVFWRSVVTAMKAAGYDDVWSIEHEDPTLDDRAAIRKNAAFLAEVL
jgi:sugar phosphate isomerase/epimerase